MLASCDASMLSCDFPPHSNSGLCSLGQNLCSVDGLQHSHGASFIRRTKPFIRSMILAPPLIPFPAILFPLLPVVDRFASSCSMALSTILPICESCNHPASCLIAGKTLSRAIRLAISAFARACLSCVLSSNSVTLYLSIYSIYYASRCWCAYT